VNFENIKISTRMSLGFGIVLVLMLAIAGSGFVGLRQMGAAVTDISADRLPKIMTAAEWEISVLESASHMRSALILDGQDNLGKELAKLADEKKLRKDYMEQLEKVLNTDVGRAAFKTIVDARAAYLPAEDKFIKLAAAGDLAGAKKTLIDEARPLQRAYVAALKTFVATQKGLAAKANAESDDTYAHARTLMIGLIAATLAISVLTAVWLARSLSRQLGGEPGAAADLVRAVAKGDLAVHIAVRPGDQTSLMAALKDMQTNLAQVVANVRENSESVATASAQIAQGNMDLSQRTEEQASALEQTVASMEQLGSTVRQNADNARQANQLAMGASTVAMKGGEVVSQVVDTMKDINASSKRIVDIISVIDGIAFQTNILALNAAVEAARAGEQGRGFAVVASEVRSLAHRSADAAKEIKSLISASVERVEQGTALVDQAGVTMTEVVGSIKRVTDIMGEISAASVEQSAGVAQVGQAVTQMDRATQQNAALVEESAAAAESLKVQAQQLVQAVAVFKLNSGSAAAAPVGASPAAQRTASGTGASAVAAPKLAAKPAAKSAAAPDRRGPNRATNVVRPAFKAAPAATARPAAPATGTDEWESF